MSWPEIKKGPGALLQPNTLCSATAALKRSPPPGQSLHCPPPSSTLPLPFVLLTADRSHSLCADCPAWPVCSVSIQVLVPSESSLTVPGNSDFSPPWKHPEIYVRVTQNLEGCSLCIGAPDRQLPITKKAICQGTYRRLKWNQCAGCVHFHKDTMSINLGSKKIERQ